MRYLPLTDEDRRSMLATIGAADIGDLYRDVPPSVLLDDLVDLPAGQSEMAVERSLSALAAQNLSASAAPFFLGAGCYRHHIPATVDHLIQRSEFLTAYTPYQPEVSQGTLQTLFEFQTQVALLTGMEVANASLYDGSTACGEAILMACRVTKRGKAILSGALHPQYVAVARTMTAFIDDQIIAAPLDIDGEENLAAYIDDDTACVVVQNPDFFGRVRDFTALGEAVHEKGGLLVVVCTEPLALGLVKSPGDMGADIFAGEGQSLGVGLNFGGPALGLFAIREALVRQMPGRLCGQTVDAEGQRGFVLTLSTREQHIRREKATSNICTNSGLCALAFSIHLALLGDDGLDRLARLNHQSAVRLADRLTSIKGVSLASDTFFNEFTLRLPKSAADVVEALAYKGILAGVPVSRLLLEPEDEAADDLLLVAVTETASQDDMDRLYDGLAEVLGWATP